MYSKKIGLFLCLFIVYVFSGTLVIPTINNNYKDPNLITYFNADEAYIMDILWKYYSGETRDSYQGAFDYGLEFHYLTDISRHVLSCFINITPGTFILILRWLHFIGWLLSFWALLCFIRYHFDDFWQPMAAMFLLAVRPAFAYFTNNAKPEPLVLFFIILGLNYTLRIIQSPIWKNILCAIIFTSIAYLIKIEGLFLLPAIVVALYFSDGKVYKSIAQLSWLTPIIIGVVLLVISFAPIIFYKRISTGHTFYEEYGLITSFIKLKIPLYIMLVAIGFIFSPLLVYFMIPYKMLRNHLAKLSCCGLLIGGLFILITLVIGFRWVLNPSYFISTLVGYGSIFFAHDSALQNNSFNLVLFVKNFILKVRELDVIIFILFLLYLIVEIVSLFKSKRLSVPLYKRLVLIMFFIPCLILLFSSGRMVGLHMLPFFVVMSILSFQGMKLLVRSSNLKRSYCYVLNGLFVILILGSIGFNGWHVIKSRMYEFHRDQDIVFDIQKWFQENIPNQAKIVSDHLTRVYLASEYKSVKFLDYADPLKNMKTYIKEFQPTYVYYNEGERDEQIPLLNKIITDYKVVLIKAFENSNDSYQRYPKSRFVIYKILY